MSIKILTSLKKQRSGLKLTFFKKRYACSWLTLSQGILLATEFNKKSIMIVRGRDYKSRFPGSFLGFATDLLYDLWQINELLYALVSPFVK